MANLLFPGEVACNLSAGYVRSGTPDEEANWQVTILGTEGELLLYPSDDGPGRLVVSQGETGWEERQPEDRPFVAQARSVLEAIDGNGACRNGPDEFVTDVLIAEAIVESAATLQTVKL